MNYWTFILTLFLGSEIILGQSCNDEIGFKTDILKEKICPEILQSDLIQLYDNLKKIHPDLYRYNSKSIIDAAYSRALKRCSTSLNLYNFSVVLMEFLSELKDSHTCVNLYDFLWENLLKRNYLPFTVTSLDNRFVITKSWENVLPVGAELISINGYPLNALYHEAKLFSPMEGLSPQAQKEIALALIPPTTNLLMNRTSHKFTLINNKDTASFSVKSPSFLSVWNEIGSGNKKNITMIRKKNQAVLTIHSFSINNVTKFRKELDNIFASLVNNPPTQLIIDLRNNTGGYILLQEYLMSFLVPKGTKYMSKYIYKRSEYDRFSNLSAIQRWKFIRKAKNAPMNSTLAKEYNFFKSPLGSVDTILNEPTLKNNKNKYFSGKCALLVNGMTMSAAANFTTWFQSIHRGLVFGTQISGTNAGTFANPQEYILENTGITVYISTMKVDLVPKEKQKKEGVLPDVIINGSYNNRLNLDDFPLEFIMNY